MRRKRQLRQTFERNTTPPARPLFIGHGVEVTDDAVWTWAEIPPSSTYLLEEDELTRATWDTTTALSTLLPSGADYHLKVMWSRHRGEDYTRSWSQVSSVMAPGADHYIALGARRITTNSNHGYFRRRVVLLGVRWAATDEQSPVHALTRRARHGLLTPAALHRDAHDRLTAIRPAIDRWFTQIARSLLRGQRATAARIAWAYAREIRRLDVPVPAHDLLNGPALVHLMHGQVDPTDAPAHLIVTDTATGHRRYVAILVPAVNGFAPHELVVPGGEWLEILGELPGVEASVRGVNHGQAGSIDLIDQGRKVARSQTREASLHGAQVPAEILDADDTLTTRRLEIQRRQDVMTTNHARWVVEAEDLDTLHDTIQQVQDRYTGIVRLETAPNLQSLLWQELLPGDRTRVPEFAQHQPMRTLAGAWAHGGSAIGDTTGPYIGSNLGSSPGPVQAHIVSRTERDRSAPTTIAFTGQSGAGKSTAVMMSILGALAEGAWCLLVDPKGDLRGVIDVAHTILGVPVQIIDVLDPDAAGTMDPLRYCPTADLARSVALDALLGALSSEDRRRGETLLEAAVDAVLRFPQAAWSTPAIISELRSTPTSHPQADLARELGETLHLRSRQAHMRAVLGHLAPSAAPLHTGRGLVYLNLAGLGLPRHNPDPDRWTVGERCAMTVFRMALHYALQQSRNVSLKKLVALSELHLITGYPEGRATVEWLARTGRALQTWLLLDTQAAVDLAQLTGLAEQIVLVFAFRADGAAEQAAQAALLRRPDSGPRLQHMQATLGTGDCIMRDRNGRIAPVHWDLMTEAIRDALSTDAADDTIPAADTTAADTTATKTTATETTATETTGGGLGGPAGDASDVAPTTSHPDTGDRHESDAAVSGEPASPTRAADSERSAGGDQTSEIAPEPQASASATAAATTDSTAPTPTPGQSDARR